MPDPSRPSHHYRSLAAQVPPQAKIRGVLEALSSFVEPSSLPFPLPYLSVRRHLWVSSTFRSLFVFNTFAAPQVFRSV